MGSAHFLECSNQQFKTVAGIVERPEREVGKLRLYVFSLPLPEQVSVRLRRRFSLPVPPDLPVEFGWRSLLSGGQNHPTSPLISNFIKSSNLLRKHALNLFQWRTPARSSKPAVFLPCPSFLGHDQRTLPFGIPNYLHRRERNINNSAFVVGIFNIYAFAQRKAGCSKPARALLLLHVGGLSGKRRHRKDGV